MTDSRTLLAEYAANGSDSAFRELVSRYLDLVYSTARRLVGGDASLAEDVAQNVFIDLARKANGLSDQVMLGGWLHRRTCHVAATLRRSERRRQARERQAMELNSLPDHAQINLAQLSPILDEAINQLAEEDRAAILARFFEQRDFRGVGQALGTKEDAARMRVNRAVDRLHKLLSRQGVALSAVTLGTALGAGAVSAAPTGLAATVAATALASAAVGAGASITFLKYMIMTKLKAGILGAVLVTAVAAPLALQHRVQTQLREENTALREQVAQSEALAAENTRLSNLVNRASTAPAASQQQQDELLKLRGQVGVLKGQLAEAVRAQAQASRAAAAAASPLSEERQAELMKLEGIAKMNYAKNWMLAFFLYSQQNQGRAPADFDSATAFLPDNGHDETLQATNQFEILYHGSINAITSPASTIVLRETQAVPVPSGGWVRTYGFADGHSEIHKTADGNFAPWEAQHLAPKQ